MALGRLPLGIFYWLEAENVVLFFCEEWYVQTLKFVSMGMKIHVLSAGLLVQVLCVKKC